MRRDASSRVDRVCTGHAARSCRSRGRADARPANAQVTPLASCEAAGHAYKEALAAYKVHLPPITMQQRQRIYLRLSADGGANSRRYTAKDGEPLAFEAIGGMAIA